MNKNETTILLSPVVGPSKPRLWKVLGPGLITGAADDDPSGIATYSQAGAQFGFQLAWTLLLTYPMMVVIQAISARIGRTTGKGKLRNKESRLLQQKSREKHQRARPKNRIRRGPERSILIDLKAKN